MKRRLTTELRERGGWLVWWLNEGRQGKPKERVLHILALLQKLDGVARRYRGMPASQVPEILDIERELERHTKQYLTWPRYAAQSDCRGIGVAHIWTSGSLEESMATQTIEALLVNGFLDRIILCSYCHERWVLLKRRGDKHCGRKCRQSQYENTPGRKARRKGYLKDYYLTTKRLRQLAAERASKSLKEASERRKKTK